MTEFINRLQKVASNPNAFKKTGRGIERETLRFTPGASLSTKPHPEGVGSALTHKYITTDFAESLLEFITPVSNNVDTVLKQLEDVHHYTVSHMGDEKLWPLSMPCFVTHDDDITLAQYGESNVGKLKTTYREGLKRRYGSVMQVISGVHFNFSFSTEFWDELFGEQSEDQRKESVSDAYFALIRNYYRFGWLIPYFFGASPALCSSFIQGRETSMDFESLGKTYYLPYATSLRLSDLGYTNDAQSNLKISLNSVNEYVDGLNKAIRTPSEEFAKIGLKEGDKHIQLNSNVLQIENELYAPIRPKRVTKSGERPSEALERDGVEYIEVRSLDVNPYSPIGVNEDQVRFLDMFLTWTVLSDSAPMNDSEMACWKDNWNKIIEKGRKPGLELKIGCQGERLTQKAWAERVFEDLLVIAKEMDRVNGDDAYQQTHKRLSAMIDDPELTISGRLLAETKAAGGIGVIGCKLAVEHRETHLAHQYRFYTKQELDAEVERSVQAQKEIEANDKLSFSEYLEEYFSYLK
ncbi:glutamate--cysteine ligase [Aliivibrio fischeri]|uniref:glutamate--cysteine ligase n=1 Tax=Aliivibrio fischeri TaxID=668 RepID=UPI001F441896|nr:glutamate--cysteine ligase [Aliivibrio fischeri]MCE7567273.1 glutamate--cysteine ligase [Aliivibrio fischeri]